MKIKVKLQQDGRIVISWPKGAMPDKETIERVCLAIQKQRQEAAA